MDRKKRLTKEGTNYEKTSTPHHFTNFDIYTNRSGRFYAAACLRSRMPGSRLPRREWTRDTLPHHGSSNFWRTNHPISALIGSGPRSKDHRNQMKSTQTKILFGIGILALLLIAATTAIPFVNQPIKTSAILIIAIVIGGTAIVSVLAVYFLRKKSEI